LDAPVKEVAAAIEHDVLDALGRGALRDELADRLGCGNVGARFQAGAQFLVQRGGGRDRLPLSVVDHLRIDVLAGAMHGEPRPPAGLEPEAPAYTRLAPLDLITQRLHRPLPSLLLAFLAEDVFARIFDALALVGLGRPEVADFRGDLPDLLLVDTGDDDLGRFRRRDRDPVRDRIDDLVAVAERELQVLTLHRGAVADAGDLQAPLESLGDAGDDVGEQCARHAPHGARALGIVARVDLAPASLHLGADVVGQHELQGAFRPLDVDGLPRHVGGDAGRNRDRLLADP